MCPVRTSHKIIEHAYDMQLSTHPVTHSPTHCFSGHFPAKSGLTSCPLIIMDVEPIFLPNQQHQSTEGLTYEFLHRQDACPAIQPIVSMH